MKIGSDIGTLREGPLHRDLKQYYCEAGSQTEYRIGKYVVDVLTDNHIVEIQTSGFGSLREKIEDLIKEYEITVVYPIARRKTLVKQRDELLTKRSSPKKANICELFKELIYIPEFINKKGFSIELAYVHIEELRVYNPRKAWRRNHWVVKEKHLVEILETERIQDARLLFDRVLGGLDSPFTTKDLRNHLGVTQNLAQKIAYCFRHARVITPTSKRKNALVYERVR